MIAILPGVGIAPAQATRRYLFRYCRNPTAYAFQRAATASAWAMTSGMPTPS